MASAFAGPNDRGLNPAKAVSGTAAGSHLDRSGQSLGVLQLGRGVSRTQHTRPSCRNLHQSASNFSNSLIRFSPTWVGGLRGKGIQQYDAAEKSCPARSSAIRDSPSRLIHWLLCTSKRQITRTATAAQKYIDLKSVPITGAYYYLATAFELGNTIKVIYRLPNNC